MLKARVMVVEDEALVSAAIETCLKNLGHQVAATAACGEEAVRKAVALDPDLVLMDIRLKGQIDGIEAARRITEARHIPIVYLTAHSDDETLVRAQSTEPYGFILKPFDEKALKAVIQMTLYRSVVQSKVRRGRDQLDRILNSIGEAVLETDVKGEISFCNQAAARLLSCDQKKARGQVLGQLFQFLDDQGAPTHLPVSEVLLEGQTLELKGCLLKYGEEDHRVVDLQLAPIRNEAGNISGVVLSFHEGLL
jgi:two-component system cell cycle sensor histidine kinase/response regulator CckA